MPDIEFKCPNCKNNLVVDEAGAGLHVNCPDCNTSIVIPRSSLSTSNQKPILQKGFQSTEPQQKKCPVCNTRMGADDVFCVKCGKDLRKGQRIPSSTPQYYGVEYATPLKTKKDTSSQSTPSAILGTCPRCNANDIFLVCMNCQKTDSFSLIDNGVECVCGHVMSQVQCPYCSTVIYPKAFRRPSASEKQTLVPMPIITYSPGTKLLVVAIVVIVGFFILCWLMPSKENSPSYSTGWNDAKTMQSFAHIIKAEYSLQEMKESMWKNKAGGDLNEMDYKKGFDAGWMDYIRNRR